MGTSISLDGEYAEKLEKIAEKKQRSMAGQIRYQIDEKYRELGFILGTKENGTHLDLDELKEMEGLDSFSDEVEK